MEERCSSSRRLTRDAHGGASLVAGAQKFQIALSPAALQKKSLLEAQHVHGETRRELRLVPADERQELRHDERLAERPGRVPPPRRPGSGAAAGGKRPRPPRRRRRRGLLPPRLLQKTPHRGEALLPELLLALRAQARDFLRARGHHPRRDVAVAVARAGRRRARVGIRVRPPIVRGRRNTRRRCVFGPAARRRRRRRRRVVPVLAPRVVVRGQRERRGSARARPLKRLVLDPPPAGRRRRGGGRRRRDGRPLSPLSLRGGRLRRQRLRGDHHHLPPRAPLELVLRGIVRLELVVAVRVWIRRRRRRVGLERTRRRHRARARRGEHLRRRPRARDRDRDRVRVRGRRGGDARGLFLRAAIELRFQRERREHFRLRDFARRGETAPGGIARGRLARRRRRSNGADAAPHRAYHRDVVLVVRAAQRAGADAGAGAVRPPTRRRQKNAAVVVVVVVVAAAAAAIVLRVRLVRRERGLLTERHRERVLLTVAPPARPPRRRVFDPEQRVHGVSVAVGRRRLRRHRRREVPKRRPGRLGRRRRRVGVGVGVRAHDALVVPLADDAVERVAGFAQRVHLRFPARAEEGSGCGYGRFLFLDGRVARGAGPRRCRSPRQPRSKPSPAPRSPSRAFASCVRAASTPAALSAVRLLPIRPRSRGARRSLRTFPSPQPRLGRTRTPSRPRRRQPRSAPRRSSSRPECRPFPASATSSVRAPPSASSEGALASADGATAPTPSASRARHVRASRSRARRSDGRTWVKRSVSRASYRSNVRCEGSAGEE
eukprot:30843-Pelagococcus_subviridis.AAC.6